MVRRAKAAGHPVSIVRILVADADPDVRAMYREIYRRLDCDVVEACDGRDALTRALVRRPALVLADAALPLIDGFSLCQMLRTDTVTRDAAVLIVTAIAEPEEAARAAQVGADAILVKPVRAELLLSESRRLMRATRHEPSSSAGRRWVKAQVRSQTHTPPQSPPALRCPACDSPLVYEHSHVGGLSASRAEQWDYYACPKGCGAFQYRHRTRRLRRA